MRNSPNINNIYIDKKYLIIYKQKSKMQLIQTDDYFPYKQYPAEIFVYRRNGAFYIYEWSNRKIVGRNKRRVDLPKYEKLRRKFEREKEQYGHLDTYNDDYDNYKFCKHCEQSKLKSEFFKDRTLLDGYRSRCKICCREIKNEGVMSDERKQAISNSLKELHKDKYKNRKYYIDEEGYKFCVNCNRSKLIKEFGKDKNQEDGRKRWCKECVNRKSRSSYKRRKKENENNESD